MARRVEIAFVGLMLGLGPIATTALADCDDARQQYRVAIEQVHDAVQAYLRCVARSQGSDGCGDEFREVRNAHDDFETAVGEIEDACN